MPTAQPHADAPPGSMDPAALVGEVLDGRFQLLSLISQGSMGAVYRAEQLRLGRVVALKLMWLDEARIHGPARETAAERFLNEAATLARLGARNTVRIYDFGMWQGRPFLVMEYIAGQSLAALVRRGPLAPARALDIAVQICRSLREAHRLGVVHRDLKPANILVTVGEDGELVKVVDFGLVAHVGRDSDTTGAGRLVGSPRYMAPEQIQEAPVDGRADLYALGLLIFQMLTGGLPFDSAGTASALLDHVQTPPLRLAERLPAAAALPAVVEWTVATALAKDPADRFASVDELRVALGGCAVALVGGPELARLEPRLVEGRCVLPPALAEGAPRPTAVPPPPAPAPGLPLLKLMLALVVAVLAVAVALLLLDPGPG